MLAAQGDVMSNTLLATTFFHGRSIASTQGGVDADVIYVVPNQFDSEISLILISNGSNSSTDISLQVFHEDEGTYTHLLKGHKVEGNDSYSPLVGADLYLHAGDTLSAYLDSSATSSSFEISISGRQYFNPVRKRI